MSQHDAEKYQRDIEKFLLKQGTAIDYKKMFSLREKFIEEVIILYSGFTGVINVPASEMVSPPVKGTMGYFKPDIGTVFWALVVEKINELFPERKIEKDSLPCSYYYLPDFKDFFLDNFTLDVNDVQGVKYSLWALLIFYRDIGPRLFKKLPQSVLVRLDYVAMKVVEAAHIIMAKAYEKGAWHTKGVRGRKTKETKTTEKNKEVLLLHEIMLLGKSYAKQSKRTQAGILEKKLEKKLKSRTKKGTSPPAETIRKLI